MANKLYIGSAEILTRLNAYTSEQVDVALNNKQDTLISGTNIKTINGQSILGSGSFTNVVQARLNTLPNLNKQSDRMSVLVYVDDNGTKSKISMKEMLGMLIRKGASVPSDMQSGEYLFLEKGEQ